MVLIRQACPNKSHRFQAISEGIFPAHDHTGKAFSADYYPKRFRKRGLPLAAGLAGCWAELRGDWKFLAQVLDLQEHYRKPQSLCHLCGACRNRPGLEFTDFAMNSPLRDSRISSDDWNAKYAVYGLPLILLPGFCIWHVFRHHAYYGLGHSSNSVGFNNVDTYCPSWCFPRSVEARLG